MPERIFSLETAIDSLYVAALLESRLTGMDSDIIKPQTMGGEQRALAAEFFVFYLFHSK